MALGLSGWSRARLEEAERLARQGLATWPGAPAGGRPPIARALTALGQSARGALAATPRRSRSLDEAVALHSARQARERGARVQPSPLANVHFYAGHFDDAGRTLSTACSAMTRQVERCAPRRWWPTTSINLGAVHFERGRYVEAERYYREALAITEAWYGPDHIRRRRA